MATGPKRPSKKKDGGRQTRSVLATTLSSSCLAVSAVTVPTLVPQNLVSFTDYPVSNVLEKLLIDKTTGRRLTMGGAQGAAVEVTPALLSRKPSPVLPRVEKSRETQGARTKKNAEVFTPSWLCAKMNDFLDVEMLSDREATGVSLLRDDAHRGSGALAASFDWRRYVDTRILEITCGEAPFIVSRYDAATGKLIPVKERIGLLDRKLRVVNENAADEEEWMKWAVRAYESVYGYEYQGDSLAIARANLLIAARAAGVQCFDTVFTDLDDEAGFRAEMQQNKDMGFDGKSLINPRQIQIVHEILAPTEKEIAQAEAIVRTIRENAAKGIGVFTLNGKMLDVAFLPGAERVIQLAKASGLYKGDL